MTSRESGTTTGEDDDDDEDVPRHGWLAVGGADERISLWQVYGAGQ